MVYLRLILLLLFVCIGEQSYAQGDVPYYCNTTTKLNVRSGPGTGYSRVDLLSKGQQVQVTSHSSGDWVRISYNKKGYAHTGYVSSRYLTKPVITKSTVTDTPVIKSPTSDSVFDVGGIVGLMLNLVWWGIKIALAIALIFILLQVFKVGVAISLKIFTICFRVVSLPFFALNVLQRYLAKPWILFYKFNTHSDTTNAQLRTVYQYVQIPLYIALTPLRFINAAYFNLFTHCTFEMYNYVLEVFMPSKRSEGYGDVGEWIVNLPLRIVKYPIWHGGLTIIESLIWTGIDTFVPALTLFHGTSRTAADVIVACKDRGDRWASQIGVWCVGAGNFAGNGIYFAPARSTAVHYSRGESLIVCRVSLGKTLDLGLAPKYVFRECGHANAHNATRWGLNNGYVTGEWWRPDSRWWEYCMYDWQNRYNNSWRIRPLYVFDLRADNILPIPGGMSHWLFRQMVIDDLMESFES